MGETLQRENQQQANNREEEEEQEEAIHLKTYKFKTPQFIVKIMKYDNSLIQKKLTGTYFKKSRKEEK